MIICAFKHSAMVSGISATNWFLYRYNNSGSLVLQMALGCRRGAHCVIQYERGVLTEAEELQAREAVFVKQQAHQVPCSPRVRNGAGKAIVARSSCIASARGTATAHLVSPWHCWLRRLEDDSASSRLNSASLQRCSVVPSNREKQHQDPRRHGQRKGPGQESKKLKKKSH
jgi:hypothetical protein